MLATFSGEERLGVSYFIRSVTNSPLIMFTIAPFIEVPPTSIPKIWFELSILIEFKMVNDSVSIY
jgi:hypothetical protein